MFQERVWSETNRVSKITNKKIIYKIISMKRLMYLSLVICLLSCNSKQSNQANNEEENTEGGVTLFSDSAFNKTVDGKQVSIYTLKSGNGLTMQATNYGCRVISLWVPDKVGKYEDVVLGYENIDRYIENDGERFLGAVVGRYANRIANGKFELDGKKHQLAAYNNGQCLHGGLKGLDMVVWNVDTVTDNSISFSYLSPDGEEGFPGNLDIKMTYTLTPYNEFKITYAATTDKPTVVNLSHHGFFNLKGEGNGTILDHELTIYASRTTPVNNVLIPSGELVSVENTPFDFRNPTTIGERINQDNKQLKNGLGYDHNWVLDRKTANEVELVATLHEPTSGRTMEIWTDQPALQFYSGNFFNGESKGKYGKTHNFRESVALETQKYPDSPNHPEFPSTRLNPKEVYTHTCTYKFMVK